VLADEGKLQLRLYVMLRADPDDLAAKLPEYRMIDHADGRLTVRAIKCMADGALGSHGALLLEPYADKPDSTGLRVQPLDEIRATALLALQHEYQLCTHAIGDRANREVLDLYDGIFRSRQPASSGARLRWRIEHVQHLHPHDIPRFADLGVIASMQANHATSDGPFVVTRLGATRARLGAYAWRSLLDAGAKIVNGTDAPVENVDPLRCFHSAVTRRLADGSMFFPEQCMTRVETLRSYTVAGAYATFQEQEVGSLEVGKRADVIIVTGNPLTVDAEKLPDVKVETTIIAGNVHSSH
jgi:predicted amidohydrolase YtcJ